MKQYGVGAPVFDDEGTTWDLYFLETSWNYAPMKYMGNDQETIQWKGKYYTNMTRSFMLKPVQWMLCLIKQCHYYHK